MAEPIQYVDVAQVIIVANAACQHCHGSGEEPTTVYGKAGSHTVMGWCRCTLSRALDEPAC